MIACETFSDSTTEPKAFKSTSTFPPCCMTGAKSARGKLPKMLNSQSA
ncbi:Uncharacterised protein [Vibrio cholerae]|nr:Uncharacterised protein [Vibrio cholerae]CSI76836.1 Uncharacterised protein [Vibrio cholerae]